MAGIATAPGVGKDQRTTGRQGAEDVVNGQVEAELGQSEHTVVGGHREAGVDVVDGVERGGVADHHALGGAGGTRGVDDVREVVGRRPVPPGGPVPGFDGSQGVDGDGPCARGEVQGGQQRGLREHEVCLGVGQDGVAAQGRLCGVHGQVGAVREQHAEDGDDLFPPLLHHDAHALARDDAGVTDDVGHGPCPAEEFGVAEAP